MRRVAGACLVVGLVIAQTFYLGPALLPSEASAACPPNYSAQYNSQSYGEVAARADQRVNFWIWYKNVGCNGWAFQYPARIGTSSPEPGYDQNSAIGGAGGSCVSTGWNYCNRVQMTQTSVNPGNLASFSFDVKPPAGGSGSYRLYVRPVIDGVTWMEDYGVWWQLDLATPINTGCGSGGRTVSTPDPTITWISWTDCFFALYTIDNHNNNVRKFGGQMQRGCYGTDSPFFSQVVSGSATYHRPGADYGAYQAQGPSPTPLLCQPGPYWGGKDVWNQPIGTSPVTDSFRYVTAFSQWTCGGGCFPNYHSISTNYNLP